MMDCGDKRFQLFCRLFYVVFSLSFFFFSWGPAAETMTVRCVLVAVVALAATTSALAPRRVRVDGQRFITVADNATIILAGP